MILVLILGTCFGVFADGGDVSIDAVFQNNRLKISGTAGADAGEAVTLRIYPESDSGMSYDDLASGKAMVKLLYTAEGGVFETDFVPGAVFSSGKYTAEAVYGGACAYAQFMLVNEDEAAGVLYAINHAATESEFGELVAANTVNLGIDALVYEGKETCINEVLFGQRPDEGYTGVTFGNEYNRALCVYELKATDAKLDAILDKYTDYIDTDYTKDIGIYDEGVTDNLRARLSEAYYTKYSVDEVITRELLVSRVLLSERYTVLRDILEPLLEELGYDLTDYNKLKDVAPVYKRISNNKSDIETFEDIETEFESAVEAERKAQSSDNSGKVSGGSGGGGGFSSVATNTKTVTADVSGEDLLTAPKPSYSDIAGHWAKNYITALTDSGAINGYADGRFCPDKNITRAEFVKIIIGAFEIGLTNQRSVFKDVPSDAWYADYVVTAAAKNLVKGTDGSFMPDSPITRQDAAVILYRLIDGKSTGAIPDFDDKDLIADYAADGVAELAGLGIINGYNNRFEPARSITRAEASAMIVRLMEQRGGDNE